MVFAAEAILKERLHQSAGIWGGCVHGPEQYPHRYSAGPVRGQFIHIQIIRKWMVSIYFIIISFIFQLFYVSYALIVLVIVL